MGDGAPSPEIVRCRVYGWLPVLFLAMWGLFLVIGLVVIVVAAASTDTGAFWFSLMWFAVICGVGWFWLAMINVEVRLFGDDSLEFRSVLRRVRVGAAGIVWIGFTRWDAYMLRFSTGAKSLRVISPLAGQHTLISELLRRNPHLELRGL